MILPPCTWEMESCSVPREENSIFGEQVDGLCHFGKGEMKSQETQRVKSRTKAPECTAGPQAFPSTRHTRMRQSHRTVTEAHLSKGMGGYRWSTRCLCLPARITGWGKTATALGLLIMKLVQMQSWPQGPLGIRFFIWQIKLQQEDTGMESPEGEGRSLRPS